MRDFTDSIKFSVVRDNLEKNNGRICCEICGKELKSINECHFDHIEAYAKGGKSIKTNCQILCSDCNLKKNDKELADFLLDEKAKKFLEGNISDEDVLNIKQENDSLNNIIEISAKTGFGIEELKNKIINMFFNGEIDTESVIITNTRHKQALYRAVENLNLALEGLKNGEFLDLVSIYVTSSLRALGEITGNELEEDLVNKIFAEFCCGK